MRRAVMLVALAACQDHTVIQLPGAALAPHLRSTTPAAACGTDIAFSEDGPIELRYRYLYDAFGRLSFARGAYVGYQFEDTIEYRWDNLDRVVRQRQVSGWDGDTVEVEALYSTLGDLVEYTYQGERHSYTAHDAKGLPAREIVDVGRSSIAFDLSYDAHGRLVLSTSTVQTTVYTYDDDARTITIDTDRGALLGVVEFDDANRDLVERWTGTDPSVIDSEATFAWNGDRLETLTYRSGSEAAPRELRVIQVETYRYDCQ